MAVAAGLDRRIERYRERSGIALVAVGVVDDRHQRLRRRYDHERDAVRLVLTEVRMQVVAPIAWMWSMICELSGCNGDEAIS